MAGKHSPSACPRSPSKLAQSSTKFVDKRIIKFLVLYLKGKSLLFLTNNNINRRQDYVEKLTKLLGFPVLKVNYS